MYRIWKNLDTVFNFIVMDVTSGMAVFLKNISFHGILLDALFEDGNPEWSQVSLLLMEGVRSGAVQPLPTCVFDRDDLEGAFRYMAKGRHIGKVLLQVCHKNGVACLNRLFLLVPFLLFALL